VRIRILEKVIRTGNMRKNIERKSMGQETEKPEDVVELTRYIIRNYYIGNLEPWFVHLHPCSVWVGTGEPMLFGAQAIMHHFKKFAGMEPQQIVCERYYRIPLGGHDAQVAGELTVTGRDSVYRVNVLFTLAYRYSRGQAKIVSHHFTYEFARTDEGNKGTALQMDICTHQFIKNLLVNHPQNKQITIKSGPRIMYIHPAMILYIEKTRGRGADIVCVDQVVPCTASLNEISEILPFNFYPIHRGYIVNMLYITSLKRYEVELISGAKIPVPARNYMNVKKNIEEYLDKWY